MRAILLLLDGLGDRGVLNKKTPLQCAKTPNLDMLAKEGMCGIYKAYKEGVPLSTEIAHLLLWGYSLEDYPGRGVIEALGEDIKVEENKIYLRMSIASVKRDEKGFFILERRVKDIKDNEVEEILKEVPKVIDNYKFNMFYTGEGDFILEVGEKFDRVSDKISDADPFYKNKYVLKVKAIKEICKDEEYPIAKSTAEAINKFMKCSYNLLDNIEFNKKRELKANFLLPKWAGKIKKVESFKDRWGLNGVVLAKSKLLKGLARYLGLDFIRIDSLKEGFNLINELNYDFIHIHTKEIDEVSHLKDPKEKIKAIEKVDNEIKNLKLKDSDLLIVTADHSTPSVGRLIHSGESVPILFYGKYVRKDKVKEFNEISCSEGHLRISGDELMYLILNYLDRALLLSLRPGGLYRYYPENLEIL